MVFNMNCLRVVVLHSVRYSEAYTKKGFSEFQLRPNKSIGCFCLLLNKAKKKVPSTRIYDLLLHSCVSQRLGATVFTDLIG